MTSLPERTGLTQLTDDELLLFDFLFDTPVQEGALKREVYSFHMNVSYNHALDDDQLHGTVERLAREGLVLAEREEDETRWFLTPLGGAQWELERRPLWDAYCMECEWTLRSGRPVIAVTSLARATAEKFWHVGLKTRLWSMGDEGPRYRCLRHHRLIPWREPTAVHLLTARGASYSSWDADWAEYEAQRTWWRNVTELDSLRKRVSDGDAPAG